VQQPLDKKVTKKSSQQKCFFAARGLRPADQAKPGTQKFRAFAAPRFSRASAKLAFPLQPHWAGIVLPDLIRSCSAVGMRITN
jgi:hypothetical protein